MRIARSDPDYMDAVLQQWQLETLRAVVQHIVGDVTDAERDLAVQRWNEQVALAKERAHSPSTLPLEGN